MASTTISISCTGDRDYTKAVKALAYQQGLTTAELVRMSIDAKFGDQLRPHLEFFAAQSECKNTQEDAVAITESADVAVR